MPTNQPKKQPDYLSRSIQMAVVMGGLSYGGFQIDKSIGLKFPVFTLILSLVGVALGIYIFVRDTK